MLKAGYLPTVGAVALEEGIPEGFCLCVFIVCVFPAFREGREPRPDFVHGKGGAHASRVKSLTDCPTSDEAGVEALEHGVAILLSGDEPLGNCAPYLLDFFLGT